MIENLPPRFETIKILNSLSNSYIPFYLTGSRYFGFHRYDSDWDFFTEHCNSTCLYLESRGFKNYNKDLEKNLWLSYPGDPNIAKVYEKRDVQIQLVVNVSLKLKAQEILQFLPNKHKLIDKRFALAYEIREWWNWAFDQVGKNAADTERLDWLVAKLRSKWIVEMGLNPNKDYRKAIDEAKLGLAGK